MGKGVPVVTSLFEPGNHTIPTSILVSKPSIWKISRYREAESFDPDIPHNKSIGRGIFRKSQVYKNLMRQIFRGYLIRPISGIEFHTVGAPGFYFCKMFILSTNYSTQVLEKWSLYANPCYESTGFCFP